MDMGEGPCLHCQRCPPDLCWSHFPFWPSFLRAADVLCVVRLSKAESSERRRESGRARERGLESESEGEGEGRVCVCVCVRGRRGCVC